MFLLKRIQIPIFPSSASCAKQIADSVGFLSGFGAQFGFNRIHTKIVFGGYSLQPDPATKVVVESPKTSTFLLSWFQNVANSTRVHISELQIPKPSPSPLRPKPEYQNVPTQSRAPLHARQHWSVELWLSWGGPKDSHQTSTAQESMPKAIRGIKIN